MKKTLTAVMIMALALSLFGCKPKDIPVSGIDLEETEVEFTELGETCQIAASVKPDDATDKTITYTSNNPEVCTVSSTGVVTATGKGEATVTVKSGDVSAEFKVIVSVRNVIAVYYNLVKDVLEQYYPTLTLYDDYTFEYYENEYSGMTLLTGTYSKFNGQYTMTVKQQKIGDMNTTITYPELLFSELTDDYIILQSQLNMSRIDDILQKDKKPFCFASYFIPDERIMSGDLYTAVHFYTDRSFELDENFMEGIELVYGVYDVEENGYYHFYVTETTNRTGYKYSPLEMQKYTGEGFCLMTDLYCTEKGTVFSMSQWHIGN